MNLSLSERSVFVERDGIRYHIRIAGQGSPLMLLHGFTGSSQSWEYVSPTLSRTHTVIRPDLLGHGKTTSPKAADRYKITLAAADIVAILDSLDIEHTALHGYSMGGRLALYVALNYPSRIEMLSLESASPGLRTANEQAARVESDDALAREIIANGIPNFIDYWERIPLFETQSRLDSAIIAAQRRRRLENSAIGLANSLRGMGTGRQPNLWPQIHELMMPVLLTSGQLDTKFTTTALEMARSIPKVRQVVVPDCGHAVHLECPEQWLAAVEQFLSVA